MAKRFKNDIMAEFKNTFPNIYELSNFTEDRRT